MKKKLMRLIPVALALLIVTGCSKLLNREYSVTEPHSNQYTEEEGSDALRAENYAGMKSAILYFVSEMEDYGVIRLYNYSGNIEDDINQVCLDVVRSDPLGAFAVDYIIHDYARIVSYYELHVYITYSRSASDIESIVKVSGYDDADRALKEAYEAHKESVYLQFSYYSNWGDSISDSFSKIYYDMPEIALIMPKVTVTSYPDSGLQRIIEVDFIYQESDQTYDNRKTVLLNNASKIIGDLGLKTDISNETSVINTLQIIYDYLAENIEYDYDAARMISQDEKYEKDNSFTAYGALVYGKAAGEGFALSFKLLCDNLGIKCQVVAGRRDGAPYCWNIVTVGDYCYHIDSASFTLTSRADGFLKSDEYFSDNYIWNTANYPACTDTESSYYVLSGNTTEY